MVGTTRPPQLAAQCAIDGRLCVDVLVRYERLHEDLAALCRRLEIPWQPALLPEYKRGLRPPEATPRAMYTAEARTRAEALLAEDLALVGYDFPA